VKKVYFCGLSVLTASLGLSQTVAATDVTISGNACTITNVTSVNHDYANNKIVITGGTLGAGCGNTPPGTVYVTASPTAISYTLGTTPGSMVIHWNSTDSGVTCTITDANASGLVTNPSSGNDWTLSQPTAVGTYNYPINCSTRTAGNTVVNPSPVQLSVSTQAPTPTPTPTPTPSGCAASQTSTPWGLTRQCTGSVSYQYGSPIGGLTFTTANPLQNLADVLGGGTWLNYTGQSYAWWIPITTGSYISMAFKPDRNDIALNLNANPTYGDGGVASISTTPGVFDVNAGAVCVVANGGNNNLSLGGYNCPLNVGQTYYLNIADVTTSGTPRCNTIKPANPQTCAASTVSYTAN